MSIKPRDKGQSGVAETKSGRLLTRADQLRKTLHLSRSRQVASGLGLAGVLTLSLWLSGIVDTAATLTAYATAVLAAGTTGLAFGTIGLYVEQRRQSQWEQGQLSRQKIADMAQVTVIRLSRAGEFVKIGVTNNSSRAIRDVYVWAVAEGMTGLYHATAYDDEGRMMAGMSNIPRNASGETLYWRLRTVPTQETRFFDQAKHMIDQPVPEMADERITAFAEFRDPDGTWWRADQDGNIGPPPPTEPYEAPERPTFGRGLG